MSDILDTTDTTQSLSLDNTFASTFDDQDNWDNDYFKVTLTKDKAYQFSLSTEQWGDLQLFDANGNDIWENVFREFPDCGPTGGKSEVPEVTLPSGATEIDLDDLSGKYIVDFDPFSKEMFVAKVESTATDKITISPVEYKYNGTSWNATEVDSNIELARKENDSNTFIEHDDNSDEEITFYEKDDTTYGQLVSGDKTETWISYTADDIAGVKTTIEAITTAADLPDIADEMIDTPVVDADAPLYDNTMSLSFVAKESGDYFISANGDSGDYAISMKEVDNTPDNYADDVGNAVSITLTDDKYSSAEDTTAGINKIDSFGDEDFFKVTLAKDETYKISTGTYKADIEFVDENGNNIWFENTTWVEGGRIITPTEEKEYTFKVKSWNGLADYTLGIDKLDVTPDNFADSVDTAKVISVDDNGSFVAYDSTGFVDDADTADILEGATINNFTDEDYFKVALNANESYVIKTDSWKYNVELVDEQGNNYWDPSTQWIEGGVVYIPTETKEYAFKVKSWGEIGDYNLTIL